MRASIFARHVGFIMLSPDKGGASGSEQKTDLEQLTEARDKIKALETDLQQEKARADKSDSDLQTATAGTATAATDLKAANDKIAQLSADLATAQAEVTKLTNGAQTTQQRAAEVAAANGVQAVEKAADAVQGGKDLKATYEAYAKLDGREAAQFWAKNEKDLLAYCDQLGRKG
jgi:septal ring factor EnvC (AmiA/AmiB activator)